MSIKTEKKPETQSVEELKKDVAKVNLGPVEKLMRKMEPAIISSLPRHIAPERFARVVTNCLKVNPKLSECTPISIISSVMLASQLGLEPNSFGQCYLIPYRNNKLNTTECQFQIGYKGLLNLMYRSGVIKAVYAEVVYENDDFEISLGTEKKINHRPLFKERGNPVLIYAVAVLDNGITDFDFMTIEEVRKHKERFSKADYGPWVSDFIEMGKKTVIKRLSKTLPLSSEVSNQIQQDDSIKDNIAKDMTEIKDVEIDEVIESEYNNKSEELADKI